MSLGHDDIVLVLLLLLLLMLLLMCVYVCVRVCVCAKDRYAVNFVPRESGLHYVHVKLNGIHIPGSPYPVHVGRMDADVSQVRAYGDGLHKGFTGLSVCLSVTRSTINNRARAH